MLYRGFKIENERAYVWRLNCWGQHADLNYIPCWYVYDAEGRKIAGGYFGGNNCQSGRADIARAKDAKALVDGLLAWDAEPENRFQVARGFIHKPTYDNFSLDERIANAFNEGYALAQRRQRGA